jgi:hypothetical protein
LEAIDLDEIGNNLSSACSEISQYLIDNLEGEQAETIETMVKDLIVK